MNRRILKKQCKRAMEILIAEHGYPRTSFVRASGSESLYAPNGMERLRDGSEPLYLRPGPLKGTMLLHEQTSYEYNEWDYALPSAVLAEIEFWSTFEPSPEDLGISKAAA